MKLNARNFMYALIALLVVFVVFNLVIPFTLKRDGFEPAIEHQISGAGEVDAGRTEGEKAVKSAHQPSGLSADALSA